MECPCVLWNAIGQKGLRDFRSFAPKWERNGFFGKKTIGFFFWYRCNRQPFVKCQSHEISGMLDVLRLIAFRLGSNWVCFWISLEWKDFFLILLSNWQARFLGWPSSVTIALVMLWPGPLGLLSTFSPLLVFTPHPLSVSFCFFFYCGAVVAGSVRAAGLHLSTLIK